MSKVYFEKYYQDHKEEYKKRNKELRPEKKKAIKSKYYKKHRKELMKYAKESYRKKTEGIFIPVRVRVLGVRIKEKALKPFKKRISLELLAKIAENTKINNEKIKFYNVAETRDTYLMQSLLKMKEIKK